MGAKRKKQDDDLLNDDIMDMSLLAAGPEADETRIVSEEELSSQESSGESDGEDGDDDALPQAKAFTDKDNEWIRLKSKKGVSRLRSNSKKRHNRATSSRSSILVRTTRKMRRERGTETAATRTAVTTATTRTTATTTR